MPIVAPVVTTLTFFSPRLPLLTSAITFSPKFLTLLKNSSPKPYFSTLHFNSQASPLMASSIIAEYAKSKRSACKTCSNTIDAGALRLGVVTRDKRKGFDMTKWHHFKCFSFDSHSLSLADSIRGFDSLKSDDQEAMKKLVEEHGKVKDLDEDSTAGDEQKNTKKKKVKDLDEDSTAGDKQKNTKKKKVKDLDEDSTAGDKQKNTQKKKKRDKDVADAEEEQDGSKKLRLSVSEEAKIEITLAASDIKDIYREAILPTKWKAFHSIIFLEKDDGLQDSSKIAAFDFDGCLAKTDVKRSGADAWSLMYPSIPEKMQKLYNEGYKLVIFTNESNIDRWKNKRQKAVDSKVGRLNNFINLMKVPIQVFIACGFGSDDPYRKPKTGMWHVMEKHFNSGIPVDMDQSFYVGDAAGRKHDHSDADIKFAQDIGLKFYVPEEYFNDTC